MDFETTQFSGPPPLLAIVSGRDLNPRHNGLVFVYNFQATNPEVFFLRGGEEHFVSISRKIVYSVYSLI